MNIHAIPNQVPGQTVQSCRRTNKALENPRKHRVLLSCLLLLISMFPAHGAIAKTADAVSVYVSILPQQYLVERIGLPYVTVSTMVGPGRSPATYEPTPRQMSQLANCAAYLRMGVPFENAWIRKLGEANPRMRIVNVNVKPSSSTHDSDLDPHTWTSPALLQTIARNIKDVLSEIDPDHSTEYETNLQNLLEELRQLDQQIRARLRRHHVTHFMVYHPAWGYFAREYGLTQIAIEQHGKEPGARSLTRLIKQARELGLSHIFVQAQYGGRSATVIARSLHAKIVIVDPLARNVISNLLHFSQLLTSGEMT